MLNNTNRSHELADLVGDYLFTDKAFVQNLSTENRDVFQKIWDEVKYLCKTVTAGTQDARKLLEVKKAFEEAYRAEMKNPTGDGGSKYSLTEYSEQQKQNWSASKRIVIYDNPQQLVKFIQNAVADKTMDKKMYFGAIPSDLAARIKADTGVNIENYNLSLGAYEIRKILKDHGTEATEGPRGQRAVVEDDFAHIVDIVLNPQSVALSPDTYMGKPAIVFTGDHNGRMNVIAVISDKRLDLFVQTIYVNTKKGNLATPTGEQAPINTPEANGGTVSNDIVAEERPGVNTKFSLNGAENVKAAEEHFGTTYKISEAGYLLTDGRLLDFSGRHEGGPGGYRTVDHRDITDALGDDYGGDSYSGGMIRFVGEGNIRLSPESGGINLSVKPNKAQLSALDRYITNFRGEVILDIDDANGNTIVSVEYPKRTYSKRIINDINAYFDNGTMPEQPSSIGQFLSLSEQNQADTDSPFPMPWEIKGEDVALAPTREDIAEMERAVPAGEDLAPVREDVAVSKMETANEDLAPVREDLANAETVSQMENAAEDVTPEGDWREQYAAMMEGGA